MTARNRHFAIIAAATLLCGPAVAETCQFEVLQDRFHALARILDRLYFGDRYYYPFPDWVLRHEKVDRMRYYEEAANVWVTFEIDEPYARRIFANAFYTHWDELRLFVPFERKAKRGEFPRERDEEMRRQEIEEDILRKLERGSLYRDPFLYDNSMLGYVATEYDYVLISAGPNRRRDLLPLAEYARGNLQRSEITTATLEQVSARAIEQLYSGHPLRRSTRLTIDINKVYDPTNGVMSDGDIIFHRSRGDDWMFSFDHTSQLQNHNLIRRPLPEGLCD